VAIHSPTSCFDPQFLSLAENDDKVMVAEGGQFFSNLAETDPRYLSKPHQIAVRGNWYDKLLAMTYISLRVPFSSLGGATGRSMLDIPEIKDEVMNYVRHATTGEPLNYTLDFRNPITGSIPKFIDPKTKKTTGVPYSIDDSYIIPYIAPGIAAFFGMPVDSRIGLNQQMLALLYDFNLIDDKSSKSEGLAFAEQICVFQKDASDSFSGRNPKFLQQSFERTLYGAFPENIIAYPIMQKIKNVQDDLDFLTTAGKEEVKRIYNIRFLSSYPIPEDFPKEDKKYARTSLKRLETALELFKKKKGQELTPEEAVATFGSITVKDGIEVYKLGEERLGRLIEFVKKATSAPADANSTVQRLFQMDQKILKDFKEDLLGKTMEQLFKQIRVLPKCRY
jgi:hypothetical protein